MALSGALTSQGGAQQQYRCLCMWARPLAAPGGRSPPNKPLLPCFFTPSLIFMSSVNLGDLLCCLRGLALASMAEVLLQEVRKHKERTVHEHDGS